MNLSGIKMNKKLVSAKKSVTTAWRLRWGSLVLIFLKKLRSYAIYWLIVNRMLEIVSFWI